MEWFINSNGFLQIGDEQMPVQCVKSGTKFGYIIIQLQDGTVKTLALKDFNDEGMKKFTSRSCFLDWVENTTNVPVDRSQIYVSDTSADRITQKLPNRENDTEPKMSDCAESNTFIQDDIPTEDIQDSEDVEDVHMRSEHTAEGNREYDTIQSKLIGINLLIPIENLIEPPEERRVRELDRHHIVELEEQFEKNEKLYTVLIGNVRGEVVMNALMAPCGSKIEVIGGNHTRKALQNMKDNNVCSITHVRMDIYKDLKDTEALRIGMNHNEVHEHAKTSTFLDKVKLFRKLLISVKKQHPDNTSRQQQIKWRSLLSSVTGESREQVSHQYQRHLHCASLPDELWEVFLEFCVAWEDKKIHHQPKTELKQTHLMSWLKIKDSDEKLKILRETIQGKLDFRGLKACAIKSDTSGKSKKLDESTVPEEVTMNTNKESEIEGQKTPQERSVHNRLNEIQQKLKAEEKKSRTFEDKLKEREKNCMILEDKLKEKEKKIRILEDMLKERERKLDILTNENMILKEKESQKQRITNKSKIQEEKLKNMTINEQRLQEEIAILENRVLFAEGAAARAREKKEKEKSSQKESNSITNDIPPCSTSVHLESQDKTSTKRINGNMEGNAKENKKRKTLKGSTDGRAVTEQEKCIAVVEYTNENLYLGVLETNQMTFCKKALGKRSEKLDFENIHSLTINHRDVQKIDVKYLVVKFFGNVQNSKIVLSTSEKKKIEDAFSEYIDC